MYIILYRPDAKDAVGSLARGLAAALLQSLEEVVGGAEDDGLYDEDEDMPEPGGGAAPSNERTKAVAKAVAKFKERELERPREVEEEKVEIKEGEKVVEEMSTLDALSCLGVCPANFEWFELNIQDPPNENCGIQRGRETRSFAATVAASQLATTSM